ncbi:hypothetical protein DDZ13_05325 [Coraliomargarita sinensis]|uniref:DUF4032 domain-containing protein n=1 Tax=Coraliomargarita sinensis TaxID=2174842 RepID=A0A317ZK70_9BACT|nr:DUF4032 domain-containing protein [Coraliomargarita sinensis]PXA04597.1 hypothetical protein DDZ13_05325 [Coraliomargarita sinensis]
MSKENKKTRVSAPKGSSNQGFAERSSLYKEFLAEREEILKHKWIESEKAGEDIGFERALLDWIRKHRESWRKNRNVEVRQPK